jgi:putative Mg2+ transporter-C (MgtC) family protein
MAQGIMTGIGFLGAGVIFKERATVRGLTTAASIWMTASLGIVLGVGFYYPAALATAAVLAVLIAFRWIERRLPTDFYARHSLRFERGNAMNEAEVRRLIEGYGFRVDELSHRLAEGGRMFEYRMRIHASDRSRADALAQHLRENPQVIEFEISPMGI